MPVYLNFVGKPKRKSKKLLKRKGSSGHSVRSGDHKVSHAWGRDTRVARNK